MSSSSQQWLWGIIYYPPTWTKCEWVTCDKIIFRVHWFSACASGQEKAMPCFSLAYFPKITLHWRKKNEAETLDWFTRRSEQVSNKTCELSLFISRQIVLRNLQPVVWPDTWLGEHNMCSSIDPGPLNPYMTADWVNWTVESKSRFQEETFSSMIKTVSPLHISLKWIISLKIHICLFYSRQWTLGFWKTHQICATVFLLFGKIYY